MIFYYADTSKHSLIYTTWNITYFNITNCSLGSELFNTGGSFVCLHFVLQLVDRFLFQTSSLYSFHSNTISLITLNLSLYIVYFIMTEPNIVRTRRQRIDQGNPGTWAGPLPTRYHKSVVLTV